MSSRRATCWQAVSGAFHVTGVDAVAVTGLLMLSLGYAFLIVATQLFMAGSSHATLAGGTEPAVSTSLRIDWV